MSFTSIVMIGGKSGIGKTTLINGLLEYKSQLYERPVSFTNRRQRDGEGACEYQFTSREKMEEMKENGEFLNFDCVYGNFYAMTIDSVERIRKNGKIAIKEIHPSNQKIIKERYFDSVSVLIKETMNAYSSTVREKRKETDEEFYSLLEEAWFDFTFTYDKNISVAENCYYFDMKLLAFLKYRERFPNSWNIDEINRRGYALIANEFTETKRMTTHNFHTLSLPFFQEVSDSFISDGDYILEVGPGRGWLKDNCRFPSIHYDALELTEEMATYISADNIIISSVSRTGIPSLKYQVVIASLADPYFYVESICEICRIIKPNGYFVFSLPAADWAIRLRRENVETTVFLSQTGQKAKTYSFALDIDELKKIMSDCGFHILRLETITGEQLNGENISPAITSAATDINKLGIITVGLCKKKESL